MAVIKKASASTLAEENIEQFKSYRNGPRQSSLSLLTDCQDESGWRVFERLLRQLYEGNVL